MHSTLTVHWHFVNLCTVILLNVSKNPDVVNLDKVNGHTSSSISTRTTNSGEGGGLKKNISGYRVTIPLHEHYTCGCRVHGYWEGHNL